MKFSSASVPFERTKQFSKLFLDYVSGNERVRKFYLQTNSEEGFRANAALLFSDEKKKVLVEVIAEQYVQTGISNKELLDKLSQKKTVTVCTGHQLCLFTGPLYFIYKIISTIHLAEELSGKGIPTVPVYWMASEDHDFAEISSVNMFGKQLKWEIVSDGPVGKLKTDSLSSILAELKTIMGNSVNADDLFSKVTHAYRPGRTLAQATREFVHGLFEGRVLIIDGDNAQLKKTFVPHMINEIAQGNSCQSVQQTSAELEELGYEVQVNPRKINLFYLTDSMRDRIEEKDGQYATVNGKKKFTREELIREIEEHPEHFSPNVVLRPLYQQFILPNIAYVGGPGELSYWLEYLNLFQVSGIPFPVLVPRNFALILDVNSASKWEKSGLSPENIFDDIEQTISSYVKNNSGTEISLEEERIRIKLVYEEVKKKALLQESTLGGAVDAELQKQMNALDAIEGKMLRASKLKMESATNQLRKVREKLLPGNVLQERVENFIPYYLKYGREFIPVLEGAFGKSSEGVQLLIAD